ncbi:hypothetical protein EV207_13430 [Scopulibacillus darangshiensis]|uniref:Uncharacterized protein n=1 Tax=Scopulibacillus darangshiensis TaxID=442528 RepID=A0A4R2NN13_9BACL|nr:hypothetical protein [Scopulibacillus darangshiensis]TCP22688.1 hypothetical protein EV207_13430 [Scopulibacillus darangshiensis]
MTEFSFKKPRRRTADISILGTTQLHLRSPVVIAWWSATVPGFGHLLLSKYLRGYMLILWEMVINTQANLNMAIVYSFTGQFDMAKAALDLRWMTLYAPVYLFAIYDSYRTTVDLNKVYILSDRENAPFKSFSIGPLEINYLDKRTPWVAVIWSLLMPGMGQLYIHRIVTAFYLLGVWILICYKSHVMQAIHYTLMANFHEATTILNKEWFLFIPSILFFAVYDAYTNTVENNKLFDKEQARYLKQNYQGGERTKDIIKELRT